MSVAVEDLIDQIEEALERGDINTVREIVNSINPAELVDLLNRLDHEERVRILPYIDLLRIAKYINRLEDEIIREIEVYKGINEIVELLYWLPIDEAVDLLQRLSPRTINQVLRMMSRKRAREFAQLLRYSPESVGGVMTTHVPVFRSGMKVGEILDKYVKKVTIGYYDRHNYIYIVDDKNKLIGWIDAKTLISINRDKIVDQVIERPPKTVYPETDREAAARIAIKYDLAEIPVIDHDGVFLGVVTLDDVLDIAVYELAEDLMRFGGFLEAVKVSYIGASVKSLVARRVPPILFLYLMNTITGGIIASFSHLIERVAVLASFLPMLADNSGNIGSQSSTIIIRSLALGELRPTDYIRVIRKELLTTILMSFFLLPVAFLIAFSITYLSQHLFHLSILVGLAVSIALFISMLTTDIIGSTLPILLVKLKLDPASVSAPLITTIGDIVSATIYFLTASFLITIYT